MKDLGDKESDLAFLKRQMVELKESKKMLLDELKSCRSKLLERGGNTITKYLRDQENLDSVLDMKKLKDKPLFVAADKLYNMLSEWLDDRSDGSNGVVPTTWQDMWNFTQIANSVRELAATAEELPLGLASGMETLRERIAVLQQEMR